MALRGALGSVLRVQDAPGPSLAAAGGSGQEGMDMGVQDGLEPRRLRGFVWGHAGVKAMPDALVHVCPKDPELPCPGAHPEVVP